MAEIELAKLRELAEAATPGPWGWGGHDDGCVELRTVGRGGQRIVTAMRGEPCMVTLADEVTVALTYEACDDCRERYAEIGRTGNADLLSEYRCPKEENLATVWLRDPTHGFVLPANAWAVRQQDYRADVARVDHPDARYLAAVSPDVLVELLDRLAGLETTLHRFLCGCGDGLDDAHREGGKCGNCLAADDEPGVEWCFCPAVVTEDGSHLVICPAAPVPAGGAEP